MNDNNEPITNEEVKDSIAVNNKPFEEVTVIEKEILNSPKKGKNPWYFIIAILLIIATGVISYFLLIKNNDVKENTEKEKEEIVYKSYDIESFALICFNNNGEIINKAKSFNKGDKITCSVSYEVMNTNPINNLMFEMSYGKGLKLISVKSSDSTDKLVLNGNTSTITSKESRSGADPLLIYELEVVNSSLLDELFISINSIIFNGIDGNNYLSTQKLYKSLLEKNIYYIYGDKYGNTYVYDKPSSESYYNNLPNKNIYECANSTCIYMESYSDDFVLFYDSGLVAYNYKTAAKKTIDYPYNQDYSYNLVADNIVRGIIIKKSENVEYYSIENNKTIINLPHEFYPPNYVTYSRDYTTGIYYDNEGYLITSSNYPYLYNVKSRILDFEGKIFKPKLSDLKSYLNSNYYFFKDNRYDRDVFYTKEGEPLFEGRIFASTEYYFNKNDDKFIVLNEDKTKFLVYDSNYKLIKSSKDYRRVYDIFNGKYFSIKDSDNFLKIIDYDENIIASLVEITDNLKYFSRSSYGEDIEEGPLRMTIFNYSIEDDEKHLGIHVEYSPSTGEKKIEKFYEFPGDGIVSSEYLY